MVGDLYDWRGCSVVQFDPGKLGGRATVRDSRMDADGVLINYNSGMSLDELQENFGVDPDDVRAILQFAAQRNLKATA